MSVRLSQPVNSVLISPYDKQSMQTKCWLLQDCSMDITATEDTYLQVKISVSQHTQTVCMWVCSLHSTCQGAAASGQNQQTISVRSVSESPGSGVYTHPHTSNWLPEQLFLALLTKFQQTQTSTNTQDSHVI